MSGRFQGGLPCAFKGRRRSQKDSKHRRDLMSIGVFEDGATSQGNRGGIWELRKTLVGSQQGDGNLSTRVTEN